MGGGGAGRLSAAKGKRAGSRKKSAAPEGGGGPPETEKPSESWRKIRESAFQRAESEARRLGVEADFSAFPEQGLKVVSFLRQMRQMGFDLPTGVKLMLPSDPRWESTPTALAYANSKGEIVVNATRSRKEYQRRVRELAANNYLASKNTRGILHHEFGHTLHMRRGGRLRSLTAAEDAVARTLSKYARTDSMEFVAEAFSRIVTGKRLTRDQYRLYKSLGGFLPSHRERRKFAGMYLPRRRKRGT